MNYYEYTFTCDSTLEPEIINDVLASVLGEAGFESFSETDGHLLAYIPEQQLDAERLNNALATFPLEGVTIRFVRNYIEAKDWNEEWEKNYYQPVEIGSGCVIHAPFHEVKPGFTYDIIIHPKMAFGTGNHETTRLMIHEILKHDFQGKATLDMGCGTAVLAILAAMKGASPVIAVDNDEWAYQNALENIRLNHVENNISVSLGGAERLSDAGMFDFIFANINRNILLNDIRHYAPCLKPGGSLLMSGFYTDDILTITNECVQYGLTMESFSDLNRWAAIRMVKKPAM
ncbi:MAG: 50S ribosomal protein L11 methyltransferase [Tannerellaceae bacterium]|jgi:ribosomal protein L11 methyltransferase|nr:50S ribosomal protein L11 methyltransferase [Tannerellaceae bacterium]